MIRRCLEMVLHRSIARIRSVKFTQCHVILRNPCFLREMKNAHFVFSTLSNDEDDFSGLEDPDFLSGDACISSAEAELSYRDAPVRPTMDDFSFISETVEGSIDPSKYSADTILIYDMVSSDGFDWKKESSLRNFREKLNDSVVVDVLGLVKNPHTCVKFFLWGARQIGYSHGKSAYNALLESLTSGRKIPEHFLFEIRDEDNEVLGKLVNVLITRCCQNGCWNEAFEELGRLKDFGHRPTKTTYIALIHVLLEADRINLALAVYNEMSTSGFEMDAFTLGCFARSLCRGGRWKDALRLIDREEVTPDTVLYTKMIRGLCEASMMDEAVAFLHRMRASSCLPNSITYGTLILGLLKSKQLGKCKKILSQMVTEGCYPRTSVLNCIVHEVCKSGDFVYACKMLRKMSAPGCKPGYVAYNILINAICAKDELPNKENMELAEEVYNEMLNAGYVLNKVNVGHLARCLCGHGKPDRAYRIIEEMMRRGFMPDTSTYTKVIELMCQSKKVEEALLLFKEMKKNEILPNVFTYTILIDNFCKVGLIQQARIWFSEMIRNGCPPNVVTYTALIHAYLKARHILDANKLFELMIAEGCNPNIVTYTALIDGHCKAGNVVTACEIYDRMRGNGGTKDIDIYFKSTPSESNMEPNVVTYGALVDGLCKVHKVAEATELLEMMSRNGCDPNHVVYDALIDGFCKVGKLDEAQKVFRLMAERGYTPNVFTYSSLIDSLFKDKRMDLALKVLSKMLEHGCSPNVVTYTEMIDGLCKTGKTGEAYKLLSMMEEKGCNPNVVTYTAIIDGYGKIGKVDTSLELLKQMSEKGCAPNLITYRVLINHCCAAGLLDEAHNLLDEMKQSYWPQHLTGYGDVIHGFSKDFIASLGLLNEIMQCDAVPILPAYSMLVDALCKRGRMESALELHREMLLSFPGQFSVYRRTYSSLIEALCVASNLDKAFELYIDMMNRGCCPELTVFVHLMKGLCMMDKLNDALLLVDSICSMGIIWLPSRETFNQS